VTEREFTGERLLDLLPAIHRIRDAEQGGPLAALLDVIGEELGLLEHDLDALYADQFVETCATWVLPYIGDLLGITGLPPAPLTSRAEVAHTIAYRRRKGSAAMLELLAHDVTGLAARADESFELLAATQYVNHVRPETTSFVSVRQALRLEHLGSPFERLAGQSTLCHTVDVRRIARRRGRYNIPNVAIFLWRLHAHRVSRSPAVPDGGVRHFRFSPLGDDAPLVNLPQTEDVLTHLAEPLDVPGPITRRAFAAAPADYYGADGSLLIERPGATLGDGPTAVNVGDVVVCDLTTWREPAAGKVAIDPVLGRIAFGADEASPPLVTFHHAFAGNLGGGEYDRPAIGGAATVRVANTRVADFDTVQAGIDALPGTGGVVEIVDSGRYEEALALDASNRHVVVRASVGGRPTIVLTGELHLSGGPGDAAVLDGLLIAGAGVSVDAGAAGAPGLGRVELHHCTLVPGIALDATGAPAHAGTPSLTVASPQTEVEIRSSIVGTVLAELDARVRISGSIVDATAEAAIAYDGIAGAFGAPLQVEGSTVIGRVRTDLLTLASNAILLAAAAAGGAPVLAHRRQEGCVRFSYVPIDAQVPRRYRCVPASAADAARVRPVLTSMRYGRPGYGQLADRTPCEVVRAADDESEPGALHDRALGLREAHLRARLDEHLRFGLEAGIFHAS
jgi:hypothetical protein